MRGDAAAIARHAIRQHGEFTARQPVLILGRDRDVPEVTLPVVLAEGVHIVS